MHAKKACSLIFFLITETHFFLTDTNHFATLTGISRSYRQFASLIFEYQRVGIAKEGKFLTFLQQEIKSVI